MSQPMIRAQKLLAATVGSRRACDELIRAGRVATVAAPHTPLPLGARLPPGTPLLIDGTAVAAPRAAAPPRYLALHKPPFMLSAWRDARSARATLADALPPAPGAPRLLHVGRLDYESEGLLLVTDDGGWAHAVAHPSHIVTKRYVLLAAPGAGAAAGSGGGGGAAALCERLLRGVALPGEARAAAAAAARPLALDEARHLFSSSAKPLDAARPPRAGTVFIEVELAGEGRNRVLRRALQVCGFATHRLLRTAMGCAELGALAPGAARALRVGEVEALRC